MTENLQKAYDAYQQALVNLRDPKVRLIPHGPIGDKADTDRII